MVRTIHELRISPDTASSGTRLLSDRLRPRGLIGRVFVLARTGSGRSDGYSFSVGTRDSLPVPPPRRQTAAAGVLRRPHVGSGGGDSAEGRYLRRQIVPPQCYCIWPAVQIAQLLREYFSGAVSGPSASSAQCLGATSHPSKQATGAESLSDERVVGRPGGRVVGRSGGRVVGRSDGRVEGRSGGRVEGWSDGQVVE